MGQIQSLISHTHSAIASIGELTEPPAPPFFACDIFEAVEQGDAGALSHMLAEIQFDLATVDEADGATILHRAIARGHGEIATLLVHLADERDPSVLNSRDRQGYTPLMHAVVARNVALMKLLVDRGGRADDSMTLADITPKSSHTGRHAVIVQALLLIEAQGDVSKALKLGVDYQRADAVRLYFDGGASTVPALQCGADAVARLFQYGCLRADDMLEALDYAGDAPDKAAVVSLTNSRFVLRALDNIAERTDEKIISALRGFIRAGADAEGLVSAAASRCVCGQRSSVDHLEPHMWFRVPKGPDDLTVLRLLISIGAPTAAELVRRNRTSVNGGFIDSGFIIEKMISFGADPLCAMKAQLGLETPEQNWIVHYAVKKILEAKNLSEEEKISELKFLMLSGGQAEAEAMLCNMVRLKKSMEGVRLLMRAGLSDVKQFVNAALPADDFLLADLSNIASYSAAPPAGKGSPESTEWQIVARYLVRRLIRSEECVSPALTALRPWKKGGARARKMPRN